MNAELNNEKNTEILSKSFIGTIPRWSELPTIQLYMDQVIELVNTSLEIWNVSGENVLTSSMVNNYVKLGIIPPPEKKRYSRTQLAYLLIICLLKQIMPISDIKVFIESQRKFKECDELLDSFAQAYEQDFVASMDRMKEMILNECGINDKGMFYSMLILKSASLSGAGRYIIENSVKKIVEYNSELEQAKKDTDKNQAHTEKSSENKDRKINVESIEDNNEK